MSDITKVFRRSISYLPTSYSVVFGVLALCFAITNLTNTALLDYFSPVFAKLVRSSQESAEILANLKFSGLPKLVLVPIKDALFFFSLLILLVVSSGPIRDLRTDLRTNARW